MEKLIRDLNSPQNQGRSEAIHTIQRQIQRLQKEPSAWQTGLDLLSSSDSILQFYGALTIELKVNADWENDKIGQNRKHVSQLLEHLVFAFVRLTSASTSDVVVTKVAATLASIFAKSDANWAHPCRHVLSCVLTRQYMPEEQAPSMLTVLTTHMTVSAFAIKAVFRLALALHEAGSSLKIQIGHRSEVQLSNNASDVWQLLQWSMTSFASQPHIMLYTPSMTSKQLTMDGDQKMFERVLAEALYQLPTWSKYVAAESASPPVLLPLFQDTIQFVLQFCQFPSLAEFCLPCMASLQNDQPRLLARAAPGYQAQIIHSKTAKELLDSMLHGEYSSETIFFVDFLEAIISSVDCTKEAYLHDPDIVEVLKIVQALTRCPGAAMVEDEVCQSVLEMVSTVAEGFSDWSESSQFDESMNALIKDVCLATLIKVRYPEDELDKQTATWEEDDYTRFEDYRFQATDFFQVAFGVIGPMLANDVAQAVSQATQTPWAEFEAILFVLISVADALANDPENCDPAVDRVFASNLWTQAVTPSAEVPTRVRRSIIRMMAETTSFLQRNPQHMISSLDFLFRSLQMAGHSNHASRAILKLCDAQRTFLVEALPQFLDTIITLEIIPLHSRCRVLSGVSALVQVLPSEEERVEPLQRILALIQNLETASSTQPTPEDDEPTDPLCDRTSMLAAVAKGLQSPADEPIDLENTDKQNMFWLDGPGNTIQQAALQMLSEPWAHLLQPSSGDLVAAACDFLRAGFKEQHPSPMKFSPSISTELVCSMIHLENPNLDQTMNTALCFISSSEIPTPESSTGADTVIAKVLAITKEATIILSNTTKDENNSFTAPTSILDFFIRSLPKYGNYIFTHPSSAEITSTFLDYALLLLRSTTDTLPRRSAAAAFVALIDLTDPSSQYMQDPAARSSLTAILDKYSPTILSLTLHLLAGECARSEIEPLSGILRSFVAKQPMRAKKILAEAIKSDSGVLTEKAMQATKPEQRARFVAQIEALRGQNTKRFGEIVKEFWISCKGGQFGYIT